MKFIIIAICLLILNKTHGQKLDTIPCSFILVDSTIKYPHIFFDTGYVVERIIQPDLNCKCLPNRIIDHFLDKRKHPIAKNIKVYAYQPITSVILLFNKTYLK